MHSLISTVKNAFVSSNYIWPILAFFDIVKFTHDFKEQNFMHKIKLFLQN